jgi:t-SNARE complex subunit (syntaxin)
MRIGILAILALFLCASCTQAGDQPRLPNAGEAQAIVCQATAGLAAAAQGLSALNEQTSVQELQARKAGIDRAVEAMKRANSVFNDARVADLVVNYENLSRTLDQAIASQNVAQAAGAVRTAAANVDAALASALDALGCRR